MIFKETGNKELPTLILLHGGGLSDWSWKKAVDALQTRYHIVTPIIDGHGEDGNQEFVSIENTANKLIDYIDNQHSGKVFAIGGLSIGAQIVTEVLSQRADIAHNAIIESALVYPIKGATVITVPIYQLFYGLIKRRWFAKIQAKTLCVSDDLFDTYYQDSLKISKQSLINITVSNGNYALKNSISKTNVKVLIIVGSREIGIMKKSAYLLHDTIKGSKLYTADGMKHGEISLVYTEKYVELIRLFLQNEYTP